MGLSLGWTFIMAAAIVVGLAVFIVAVLRADRTPKNTGPAQEPGKHQDVVGGRFDASGGRQVMPRRDDPPAELGSEASSRED